MRLMGRIGLAFAIAAAPVTWRLASAQEGPLHEPSAVPAAAKTRPAKAAKTRARKTGSLPTKADALPQPSSAPTSLPFSAARRNATTPANPISFGLKWNGANDTAERTRVQNYNGEAAGTGAAVGLKLHF